MTTPHWFEWSSTVALLLLLGVDVLWVARRPHVPTVREASSWVAFYVALALLFAGLLVVVAGGSTAAAFTAGWLTEYSLSVDNLFVFALILSRFQVPREYQQKALLIGILLSLVLRGGFILIGAEVLDRFSWIFYLFGIFLVYTAYTLARGGHPEFQENVVIRLARRTLRVSPGYYGGQLTTGRRAGRADGATVDDVPVRRRETRRRPTMMVIVLVALGTTDLLFALDSIPAIFGLTTDPFIVFAATLFALMGLRQLYFLLGGLLDRLSYLSQGLAVILGFIGVKLILESLHDNEVPFINGGKPLSQVPEVPNWLSLSVIVGVLLVTGLLGLRERKPREAM